MAYVFVHLGPELETARIVLARTVTGSRVEFLAPYDPVAVMVGFMLFYGIGHLVRWARSNENTIPQVQHEIDAGFRIHMGAFALYVALVSYLRINSIEGGDAHVLLFAVAMGSLFLTADHAFRRDYGVVHTRVGRFALAGAALTGWTVGAMAELSRAVVILLFEFVAGAVIANSLIEELPPEKASRF